ncbi:MAG TPA: DUF447 domain-containing protein [Sulfolobales archaeon]|nr:DUF447 domain-containing protein [Sulfolobales archaeon]
MVLNSDLFWQGCRVVEAILCLRLGNSGYSYCSPLGLRREDGKLIIRVYRGSSIGRFLESRNNGVIYICRDPMLFYKLLYEGHVVSDTDRELWGFCGVIAEIHVNIYRYDADFDDYIVNVLSYHRVEPKDPRLVARICRSENLFLEAVILDTRLPLIARGPSSIIEKYCLEHRYFVENSWRLSSREKLRKAILNISRDPCYGEQS